MRKLQSFFLMKLEVYKIHTYIKCSALATFKTKMTISILLFLVVLSSSVFADFDCESTVTSSDSKCPSELKCIYDEAYESRSITSCRCRTVINAFSLPRNTLNYTLFRKVCSQHGDRLQELLLNDAELEFIDNQIFTEYRNLRSLKLAGNVLRLNFSEAAEGIVQMDLSTNRLTSLKSSNFDNLKVLKMVNLAFNRLEKIDGVFTNFKDLEEIYLNNNQLTIIENDDFYNLPNLRILNLAHNSLVVFGNNLSLPNLQQLFLNDNKLISLKRNDFEKLPNLVTLNVAHNLIMYFDGGLIINRGAVTTSINNNNNNGNGNPLGQQQDLFSQLAKSQQNLHANQNWLKSALTDGTQNNFGDFFTNLSNQHNGQNSNKNSGWFIGVSPRSRRKASESTPKPQNSGFFIRFGAPPVNNQATIPKSPSKVDLTQEKALMSSNTWLKMELLNLAENRMRDIPPGFLDNLPELRSLNVSRNELTRFDFNQLNASSKLAVLDMRGNRLIGLNLNLLRYKWSLLKVVDFDLSVVRCDEVRDVFAYFREKGIVVKSCAGGGACC